MFNWITFKINLFVKMYRAEESRVMGLSYLQEIQRCVLRLRGL